MITELKSIPDIWKWMPSEIHARRFLEGNIWSTGRHFPHCGSVGSSALRDRTCRLGLYQCRDCRLQFKMTTPNPMHGTKLDLRVWISAMFLVLASRKGISLVVIARLLGVNQETAWKLGHKAGPMKFAHASATAGGFFVKLSNRYPALYAPGTLATPVFPSEISLMKILLSVGLMLG